MDTDNHIFLVGSRIHKIFIFINLILKSLIKVITLNYNIILYDKKIFKIIAFILWNILKLLKLRSESFFK